MRTIVILLMLERLLMPFFGGASLSVLTRYAGNPVLTRGGPGAWDNDSIAGEQVFYDTRLAQWVMVYCGLASPLPGGAPDGVGLAYSSDLLTWTKEGRSPVFQPNANEYDIATANIVQLSGSSYRMYYQASGGPDGNQIYAASSSDLITWTRMNSGNVVLPVGGAGAWDSDAVFDQWVAVYGGVTYIYYGGQKNAMGTITRGIGYATDTTHGDGITFTKYASNPILTPSGGESQINLGAPSIIGNATTFDMFYDSSTTPGDRYINHAHTTNGGTTWDVVDYRYLGPASSGWDSTQVFDAAAVTSGGLLYLFYAGSLITGGGLGLSEDIGVARKVWP
jgi:hypothetical protein